MIRKVLPILMLFATAGFAQYKTEPAGPPPTELDASVAGLLQKDGLKITGTDNKVLCEIWLRSSTPSAPKAVEENVSMPTIPHGSLLGVIRFPGQHADRRGQGVKPGMYTMRFSYYPQNGDHQGAAPQRDFMILSQASVDKDGAASPAFEALIAMSRKASGTPHPLVFSAWKDEADAKPGMEKQGDHDWVLHGKIGTMPVAIILVGRAEA